MEWEFKDDNGIDCSFGSISTATLHPNDLFCAFQSECVRRKLLNSDTSFLTDIICRVSRCDDMWADESIDTMIAEFMEKLETGLPEDIYFGNTEGDSSDFGYWRFNPNA